MRYTILHRQVRHTPVVRAAVTDAQRLLNVYHRSRKDPLEVDGIFGPNTERAVTEFQAEHHLVVDGIVGGRTWAMLERVAKAEVNAGGPGLPWGEVVGPLFVDKVRTIAQNLKTMPQWLMAVMAFETGRTFSPSVKNAAGSGATGLIQFMPATARAMGTSTARLAAMTALEQLDYVHRYLAPYTGRMRSLEDAYMAVLYPKAVGRPNDYVLFAGRSRAYVQNRGLDVDRDGRITKAEAARKVRNLLEAETRRMRQEGLV